MKQYDDYPRYWGAGTIIESWLDWVWWAAYGIEERDRPVFAALLNAAERVAWLDPEAAKRTLAQSGYTPRRIVAAGIKLLAVFLAAAKRGLAAALRQDIADDVTVSEDLRTAWREVLDMAEALATVDEIAVPDRVPDDFAATNYALDLATAPLSHHAFALARTFGFWWRERPEEFAQLRGWFAAATEETHQ